jgi:hypothetical protein
MFLLVHFCLLWLLAVSGFRQLAVEHNLYENDYRKWIDVQINLINGSRFDLVDKPNLVEELRMMAADRATVRGHLNNIIVHLLKIVCDPLNPHLRSWLAQVDNFRRAIMRIPKDDTGVKRDLREYAEVTDKRSKDREFTRLENVLQEEWEDVIKTKKGRIAYTVWLDSEKTIIFNRVPPETCPLTLEQVLEEECFPRKEHYGSDLVCSGRSFPNKKQEKQIQRARKENRKLDDSWIAPALCHLRKDRT